MKMIKRLHRSKEKRIFFGVCGGVSEYLGVDPVIIRILWILLVLWIGTGIWAYIIAIFLIPQKSGVSQEIEYLNPKEKRSLHLSSTDRIVLGVCGGIGDFLLIDSTVIRLLFVFLICSAGFGLLIYLALALLMPQHARP